jgi:hypothetical protein
MVNRSRVALLSAVVALAGACTSETTEPTTPTAPTTTTTILATTTTTSPRDACRVGAPRPGVDIESETFFDAYKYSFNDQLIGFLGGDGPVHDPWMDPALDHYFPDVETWVAAGNEITDRFYNSGYGMGEPFRLFTTRRNEFLESQGITDLTLTLDIWANQDCEWRVEVHSPVASPDPCLLEAAFPDSGIEVCTGPFPPTAGQSAVWTGVEVFYIGGRSGSVDWKVKPAAFLFDPVSGAVGAVSEPPVDEGWGALDVVWDGARALVVGQNAYINEETDLRPRILAYDPVSDVWAVVTIFPEEFQVLGTTVFTGTEVIFAGGGQNQPSDAVWVYSLADDTWREVQGSPLPMVENARGVWTGTEAIFIGGYSGAEEFVHHAYDPVGDIWRELPDPGVGWIQYQDLFWTGDRVIVAPMHIYGEEYGVHNSLSYLLYDPARDDWSWTAENPIQPPIRGAVTWTGEELLVWGGFSSNWIPVPEGAAYDPKTDTWRVLSASPLSTRTDHSGTWTEQGWVIIGGSPDGGTPGVAGLSDGAIYDPATDTWEYLGGS